MKKLILVLCLFLSVMLFVGCEKEQPEEIKFVDVVVVDQYEKTILVEGQKKTEFYIDVKLASQKDDANAKVYIVKVDYKSDSFFNLFEIEYPDGKLLSVNEKDLKVKN